MTKTTKENVWIRPEIEEVVPKFFVQNHTNNKCVSIEKIDQLRKELKELRPSIYKQLYDEQIDTLLDKFPSQRR